MKINLSLPLVFTAGIFGCLLGACTSQVMAQPEELPSPSQATIMEEDPPTSEPSPALSNTAPPPTPEILTQTQTANGIALTAANFRFEQNQLMVDTCFDLPDDGDWIIWAASLVIMDKEIEYSGTIPMSNQLTSKGQAEQRCDTVYFEGLEPKTNFSNATFVVERILAYPREGEVCSPEYLAKYQQALAKKGLEITVECFVQELNQGGMSGIRVASKPEIMSQEEAESLIHDHDFFLDLHGIEGPWTFTFSLEK